jgi:hypothetical protein
MAMKKVLRAKMTKLMHESDVFYMVDYDFKRGSEYQPSGVYADFYRDFKETFGQKISEFKSTDSVLMIPTLDMALKAKELVEKHGGRANIRKAERI